MTIQQRLQTQLQQCNGAQANAQQNQNCAQGDWKAKQGQHQRFKDKGTI